MAAAGGSRLAGGHVEVRGGASLRADLDGPDGHESWREHAWLRGPSAPSLEGATSRFGGDPRPIANRVRTYELPVPPRGCTWSFSGVGDAAGPFGASSAESLIPAIRSAVEPPVWGSRPTDASVQSLGTWRILVDAPERVQGEVARFLRRLRWHATWPELGIAGAELAEIRRRGTDRERACAADTLASAEPAVRDALEVAAAGEDLSDEVFWSPDPAPRRADRIPLEIEYVASSPTLLRDLGIDSRDLGDTGDLWIPPRGRSGAVFLDDTQLEVLERVERRTPSRTGAAEARVLDSSHVWLCEGERTGSSLGADGYLEVRGRISGDRRFACLEVRVRSLVDGSIRFLAPLALSVPDGGSPLLVPLDALDPASPTPPTRWVRLTVGPLPPGPTEESGQSADASGDAPVGAR